MRPLEGWIPARTMTSTSWITAHNISISTELLPSMLRNEPPLFLQKKPMFVMWERGKVATYLWCDLRKPVTWCKIDILSYWYHLKVWIILFPELFTWISSDMWRVFTDHITYAEMPTEPLRPTLELKGQKRNNLQTMSNGKRNNVIVLTWHNM